MSVPLPAPLPLPPPPPSELFEGMNVYLAARYSRREEMLGRARELERLGFRATARWIHGAHTSGDHPDMNHPVNKILAHHDRTDIIQSDIVLHFTEPEDALHPRGSRHVEFGIAYERGKLNYVVGPFENIFHHFDAVLVFGTWEAFLYHFTEVGRFLKARNLARLIAARKGGEYEEVAVADILKK